MAASEETLSSLHEALTTQLLARINSGEATAADMAVARGILKDNNITCAPGEDNAIGELQKKLDARRAKREKPRLVGGTASDLEGAAEAVNFMVGNGS